MPDQYPVLKTKLYRPPITDDLVHRTELLKSLNKHIELPFTFVSAPAGYGKSYTISQWIEDLGVNHAWISLDSDHNTVRTFLEYLLTSIRLIYPEAFEVIDTFLKGVELPPVKELAYELINELDAVEDQFMIVLDDYHEITNSQIHELLNTFVEFPPQKVHIVLITRIDPPLKLNRLRAYGRIHELRVKSLSFNKKETETLCRKLIKADLKPEVLQHLKDKTEGWVVGLRLALFYANQTKDANQALLDVKGDIRLIANFLIDEVLSKEPQQIIQYLLSTAILDRFNAEIIEAINMQNNQEEDQEQFMKKLQRANLFLMSLDQDSNWYRYHHLFRELLFNQLKKRFRAEEITELHLKAAHWFRDQELHEEAIDHFLSAGDDNSAIGLVEKNAHTEFVHGIAKVEKWLYKLPEEIKEGNPALLLFEAWHAFGSFQLEKIPPIIEKVESLLVGQTPRPRLSAEINFFKGNFLYWMGETEASIKMLQEALQIVDELPVHVRGNIELVLNMALQRIGKSQQLIQDHQKRLLGKDKYGKFHEIYMIASLTFTQLLSGNFRQAEKAAGQMKILSSKTVSTYFISWSHYLKAMAQLNQFNLEGAAIQFSEAIKNLYGVDPRAILDAMAGLALVKQFNNDPIAAGNEIHNLVDFASVLDDPQSQTVAHSAAARAALLQGRLGEALEWESTFNEPVIFSGLFLWLESPWITKAKILIAEGSNRNLEKAEKLLLELNELVESSNLQYHQVEVNMLLAIVFDRADKKDEAEDLMKMTVNKAKNFYCIRPFVEMGKYVTELLNYQKEQQVKPDFIDIILSKLQQSESIARKNVHPEPTLGQNISEKLSRREFEVIKYVADGFINKEIAQRLFISEVTIKKHLYNVFQKLEVKNRMAMVQKVKDLGMIQ